MSLQLKLATFSRGNVLRSAPHRHPFYELGFVIEGECYWILDEKHSILMKQGDFILISPEKLHRESPFPVSSKSPNLKKTNDSPSNTRLAWVGWTSDSNQGSILPNRLLNCRIRNPAVGPRMENLMTQIYLEQSMNESDSPHLISLYLEEILIFLQRGLSFKPNRQKYLFTSPPGRTHSIIRSAIHYLEHNLEKPLNISQMARFFSLSPSHFTALFRKHLHMPPREFIHLTRMKRARKLLQETDFRIKEIASACGYVDSAHFCRRFLKENKLSPLHFRRNAKAHPSFPNGLERILVFD